MKHRSKRDPGAAGNGICNQGKEGGFTTTTVGDKRP